MAVPAAGAGLCEQLRPWGATRLPLAGRRRPAPAWSGGAPGPRGAGSRTFPRLPGNGAEGPPPPVAVPFFVSLLRSSYLAAASAAGGAAESVVSKVVPSTAVCDQCPPPLRQALRRAAQRRGDAGPRSSRRPRPADRAPPAPPVVARRVSGGRLGR